MKFLVTGITGQLGHDIVKELSSRGYTNILAPTSKEMDITNIDQVRKTILQYQPDIIIHCASYTAVDNAEKDFINCYKVNVDGTKNIIDNARLIGSKVIYISTDYVFDGTKNGIYEVEDQVNPLNIYGKTKELGEKITRTYSNHIIIRTSWVFGINGNNFIKTMLKLSKTKKELTVVSDQIGSPTYTEDLSKLIIDMSLSGKTGIYHATNEGYCSWYELAKYIFQENEIDVIVNPISTEDYNSKAKRPLNSKLSKEKLEQDGFTKLPTWQDAVKRYTKTLNK